MTPLVAMDANTKDVLLALIAGVPSWVAAVATILIRQHIKTPSNSRIGELVERTHAITSTNSALLQQEHAPHEAADG